MAKNILYLIDTLTPGGTEFQLLEQIRLLDRNRFLPHVCVMNTPAGEAYDQLQIPKSSLHFTSFRRPAVLRDAWNLIRFIRRHRIDLVQTYFQDPFLLAALTKPFHRARLIGSFRDLGFWRSRGQTLKMRLAYPFYDGYIANSCAVRAHYVTVDGLDPAQIEVVYNGLDIVRTTIDPVPPRLPEVPLVGIVANLNRPVKRVQDFIAAAALVYRHRPSVRFCVVGGGHLQPELESQARTLGLGDAITFTGLIDNPLEQVKHWYLGVITSETEGFCNAILEYMACGLPVIATAAGGNVELIADGENGFLVPVGAPETLAESMLRLIDNRAQAQAVGSANARRIREDFAWDKQMAHYQQYLERVFEGC